MKLMLTILLLALSMPSLSSQRAITDTGDEVILNDDGTWELDKNNTATSITENKEIFIKPKKSSFLLKSKKNKSAYWINTNKWTFKKATNNPDAEYELQLKNGDLYGMTISEEIEIDLEELANLAISIAKGSAPDLKVVTKEYRIVNGKKVIFMEMRGTLQGIKFTYLGYYFSDKSGSTQLVTYTETNLVNKYKKDVFDLLNGLVTY